MAAQMSPLRRWKRFLGAFDLVDAAIEAADPVRFSRHEFRSARGDIVEHLCNTDDHDWAERLRGLLDDMMAEALETLRLVPVAPNLLVSTELAESVLALMEHESERVRVLARGIVSGWRASVQDHAAKVTEALHKLHDVKMPKPKETVDQQRHVSADPDAKTKRPPKIVPEPLAKKTVEVSKNASDPVAGIVGGDRAWFCSEEKVEAAKRKLHEGYQQAKDAKRQRRVQVVESPEMLEQRRRKMHPILRERSLARCASSMVKKTFSVTRQIHMGS